MRSEKFLPDGKRLLVTPSDIAAAWRQATSKIPAQYAVGTALHETSYTLNEVDTEDSGFVSKGIFQLSDEEAKQAGLPQADLLSLAEATAVFAKISEARLATLSLHAKVDPAAPPPDIWGYLAIAHNAGLSTATRSIDEHGMRWAAFCARNAATDWGKKIAAYGSDCISGGPRWHEVTAP